jgi:hypothetical protein
VEKWIGNIIFGREPDSFAGFAGRRAKGISGKLEGNSKTN